VGLEGTMLPNCFIARKRELPRSVETNDDWGPTGGENGLKTEMLLSGNELTSKGGGECWGGGGPHNYTNHSAPTLVKAKPEKWRNTPGWGRGRVMKKGLLRTR